MELEQVYQDDYPIIIKRLKTDAMFFLNFIENPIEALAQYKLSKEQYSHLLVRDVADLMQLGLDKAIPKSF